MMGIPDGVAEGPDPTAPPAVDMTTTMTATKKSGAVSQEWGRCDNTDVTLPGNEAESI